VDITQGSCPYRFADGTAMIKGHRGGALFDWQELCDGGWQKYAY